MSTNSAVTGMLLKKFFIKGRTKYAVVFVSFVIYEGVVRDKIRHMMCHQIAINIQYRMPRHTDIEIYSRDFLVKKGGFL